jgi:hypothetical protein
MLRNNICYEGMIDFEMLYRILKRMGENIKTTGVYSKHDLNGQGIIPDGTNYYTQSNIPHRVPIRQHAETITSPLNALDDTEAIPRKPVHIKDLGTMFGMTINDTPTVNDSSTHRETFTSTHEDPVYYQKKWSHNDIFKPHRDDKLEIAEDVNNYSELLGQVTARNTSTYADYIANTGEKDTLFNNTFGGLVEKDVLGYRPPGHLIGSLYNANDHFTVVQNGCLGATPSDEKLWQQCTSHDTALLDAINGEPWGMLSGLNGTIHH